MAEVKLTADNFDQEVLKSDVPVLVDFFAEWCGPCKQMAPVIEELAKEYEGQPVKIAKLNVDEAGDIPQKYGILSIPTFKIFKGGEVVDEFMGAQPKDAVKQKIEAVLS